MKFSSSWKVLNFRRRAGRATSAKCIASSRNIRIFSYVALLSRRGLAHSIGAALLVGVDFMAALDEILYHQILAWHHFYDRSTFDIALLSDGVLHIGELLAFAAGFFLLFDLCRRESLVSQFAQAGFVLGMGAFHWCSVWKSLCLLSP